MSDTDKKLDEIRARHEHDARWLCAAGAAGPQSHDDRAWLLGQIERLRAENNHLRRVGMNRPSAGLHKAAMAELRAENERLCVENARRLARVKSLMKAIRICIDGGPRSDLYYALKAKP
jgi:hypothetical protein